MRWRWNGCPKPSRIFTTNFAPDFGRREAREHSRHYLQALLVQSEERRNAENWSETVPASTAASRRVSLGRRRSHRPVAGVSGFAIGGSPGGVGAGRQRFSQAGGEVGGSGQAVLRGVRQDRQLPGWGVSGARGTPGQSAGGQAAVSAPGVDWGRGPLCGGGGASAPAGVPAHRRGCQRTGGGASAPAGVPAHRRGCQRTGGGASAPTGVPAHRRGYRSKTELALEMVEEAQARGGYLKAQWVAGDSAFGMSPTLREGLAATGILYVLDVRPDMTVWPLTDLDRSALPG